MKYPVIKFNSEADVHNHIVLIKQPPPYANAIMQSFPPLPISAWKIYLVILGQGVSGVSVNPPET